MKEVMNIGANCNYLLTRDKRSRNHVASDVQPRHENVRNGINGNQEPDPLRWNPHYHHQRRNDDNHPCGTPGTLKPVRIPVKEMTKSCVGASGTP